MRKIGSLWIIYWTVARDLMNESERGVARESSKKMEENKREKIASNLWRWSMRGCEGVSEIIQPRLLKDDQEPLLLGLYENEHDRHRSTIFPQCPSDQRCRIDWNVIPDGEGDLWEAETSCNKIRQFSPPVGTLNIPTIMQRFAAPTNISQWN